MEKEFIPYEQALALKELGFGASPIGSFKGGSIFYYEKDKLYYDGQPMYSSNYHEGQILAPLYQQAFRWFREKYGYFHLFDYQHDDSKINKGFFFNIINIDNEDFFFPEDFENEIYRTHEEVELACLRKLIEIIKNK